jgi:hypothetical protein
MAAWSATIRKGEGSQKGWVFFWFCVKHILCVNFYCALSAW